MAPMAEVMYVLKQGIEIDFNTHTKVKRIAQHRTAVHGKITTFF